MRRIQIIKNHLIGNKDNQIQTVFTSSNEDDEIVICYAKRTAIGKAKRGSFKDSTQDQLLAPLFKNAIETLKLNTKDIGDVVIGNVLPKSSQSAVEIRLSTILGGLPQEVPSNTVNRQCSSGLQAIANVASAIKSGFYDIGIAGGVELMSANQMGTWDGKMNPLVFENELAKSCLLSMGVTSDNVSQRYNVSRKIQDEVSVSSHKKAFEAKKTGKFRDEIVPITVTVEDGNGNEKQVTVSEDEGIRGDSTFEGLSKLKPVFSPEGTTTAGNSSQLSDGAAVVVVARRSYAKKNGLPIIGSVLSYSTIGVDPSVMGIGPAVAIPLAVKKAGLKLEDIDLFEINEAFASQYVYSAQQLNIPFEKINVNGGAIALGHPLGCTGSRQTATILNELRRRKGKYGVISMCIGTGMGAAMVIKAEY
eukprot:TRINITY_DN405_c0_g1_i1.p1 TRINITY_DN405_c0_g1~~TRINITY_DN405_c0_g1_i1.p1  ORF type:complete len:430 (+),score=145.72 TRINITY_DN405_c0_g1_i1:34-1290(+)